MVGATGVEPARIAPKDPKSFASANSATRPDRLTIFAAARTVNTFSARACRLTGNKVNCYANIGLGASPQVGSGLTRRGWCSRNLPRNVIQIGDAELLKFKAVLAVADLEERLVAVE